MALWYQVSYVRLGTCEEGRERGFGGDWGGTEGIGELILLSFFFFFFLLLLFEPIHSIMYIDVYRKFVLMMHRYSMIDMVTEIR